MKAKIKRPTYVLVPGRTHIRYRDIGHHPGGIIWWIDGKNQFKSVVSTGTEYHHGLYRWADWHWRGRVDPVQKIGTMMPPLDLYTQPPEELILPGWIIVRLRRMGAVVIYVDTVSGMHKLIRAMDRKNI